MNETVIASINVNHPLPLFWNLNYDKLYDTRNKVLFGLKVIEQIFKRYYNLLYMEGKVFDLKAFLDNYREKPKQQENKRKAKLKSQIFDLTGVELENQNDRNKDKIILMKDEYKPKDFAIGKISKFYRQELTGPNLKQLEAKRRIIKAHEE